jgi:hypothetical protein
MANQVQRGAPDQVVVLEDEPPSAPQAKERAGRHADRRTLPAPRAALAAFVCYLGTSVLAYALPVWSRFGTAFAGFGGGDAFIFTWSLRWWPYAVSHGLDPLHPNVIWAPHGISLAWVTSIPGPALVMAPITSLFGPVVSENLLTVLAPALAGWGAYLLCRKASGGSFAPALVGGYLFGFSTYMVGQLLGHPNLFLIFPVPLVIYLVVRYVEGSLGKVRFVALMALALIGLFSISTEVFASTAFFGAIAFAGAWLLASGRRRPIFVAGTLTLAAYAITAAIAWPFIHAAIDSAPTGSIRPVSSGASSIDALSFLIPRWSTFVGGQHFFPTTNPWPTKISEDGAYLSPVLILVLVIALGTMIARRDRVSLGSFGFACFAGIASLGAVIHVNGREVIHSLWLPFSHVPVLQDALPQRFTMFMWLGISVVVARWLAGADPGRSWWRYLFVLGAVVLLFPNVWMPGLDTSASAPVFFQGGSYRTYLPAGSTVLIIHGSNGQEMRWQEVSDFWFSMAQGHNGSTPPSFARNAAYEHISHFNPARLQPAQLLSFVRSHGVSAVIVQAAVDPGWRQVVVSALGVQPVRVEGVYIYRPEGPGGF